jgi:hypothetical protein
MTDNTSAGKKLRFEKNGMQPIAEAPWRGILLRDPIDRSTAAMVAARMRSR